MEAFETFEHAGMTCELHYDEEPESPREWSNAARMVCWHPDYALGDYQLTNGDGRGAVDTPFERDDFRDLRVLERYLRLVLGAEVVLPLYLLDHSGLSIRAGSASPFDPGGWDTTMIGFVYTTPETREECGTPADLAEQVARAEVSTYNDYLTGNVHGYVVRDPEGNVVDSLWGMYPDEAKPGDPFGLDYVRGQARSAAEAEARERAINEEPDGPDVYLAGKVGRP